MIRIGPQHGYILLPVVLAIALIATIAFLLNHENSINLKTLHNDMQVAQAEYVAQGGLKHALWQTKQQGCGPYTDITNQALASDSYTTTLTTDLGSTTNYPIVVDQDTWIRNDHITEGNPTDSKLHIKFDGGKIERPLYRYDLSSISTGSTILSATAWFYVTMEHPDGPVDIHHLTKGWTGASASWETMGDEMDSAVLATIPSQPARDVWVYVNLTAQVQAWVNGQPNYGIALNSTTEGTHVDYASQENANQPYLEVVVGTSPSSPATLTSVGTLDNGVSRGITRNNVSLQQRPPGTRTLHPDATQGIDTYIWAAQKFNNYGDDDETWVASGNNNTSLALFRFDLTGIPAGAKILDATLSLYHRDGNDPNVPVTAHRITNPWNEGEVTWNKRDSSTNWDTAGGDFDPTEVSTTLVGPTNNIRYEWDLASLIEGWLNGTYPNCGVALRTVEPGIFGERFDTSDHSDLSRRPRLTINYSCTCGSPCLVPQGSGKVLMVVVNPTALVPEDAYKKTLFESWGYTVDILSESANQSSYDAAVATSDVVFISETVNASQVGSKLADVPIGVVSQDGTYNGDLGIASSSAWPVGSAINVIDNSHYITLPFPSGALDIYSANMEGLSVSGTEAPGLQTQAEWGGAGALVVLDQGAQLDGGGTAAGRRVMLPLGREANFNWNYLNSNGRLLVQRSLAWGMNADAVSSGNLLLVVGNAGSPSTSDSDRKSLIESWGYSVTLIDDGDSPANYDTALADVDVVYIAGSSSSAEIGTNLTAATVGVLSEDIGLVDELGIAEPLFVKKNSQHINVIDNTHYVTSGFSLGALQLYSYVPEIWTVSGTLAPGLELLGETQDAGNTFPPGLAVLETGAEVYGGGFAAGRRVQVPWAQGSFDINALNADGQTLMRRAIEWAAGAGGGGGGGGPCSGTYRDEFNARVFSGSDGTIDWSTNPWSEVGENDGPTKQDIWVGEDQSEYQLRTRDNDNGGEGVERVADLSGAATAALSFDYRRRNLDGSSDYVAVLISTNGTAGPWTELDRIGTTNDSNYQPYTRDISGYISANTAIRLLTSPTMGPTDTVWFDNVQIEVSGCAP